MKLKHTEFLLFLFATWILLLTAAAVIVSIITIGVAQTSLGARGLRISLEGWWTLILGIAMALVVVLLQIRQWISNLTFRPSLRVETIYASETETEESAKA